MSLTKEQEDLYKKTMNEAKTQLDGIDGEMEKELQKAREAMKWMDQIGDTEGIKYLVLEDDGIPKRILLKIS